MAAGGREPGILKLAVGNRYLSPGGAQAHKTRRAEHGSPHTKGPSGGYACGGGHREAEGGWHPAVKRGAKLPPASRTGSA